jgi:hypothetical protein
LPPPAQLLLTITARIEPEVALERLQRVDDEWAFVAPYLAF